MKPLIWASLYIFSLFFPGCSDLERDNPLDPANPSSFRESVAVAEAFVNTNPAAGVPYNGEALRALDSLKTIFGDRLLVIQYHRNTRDFTDSLAVEPLAESRYSAYTTEYDDRRFKGVPDIFINGPRERIQGASSAAGVSDRALPLINAVLSEECYFTMEADIRAEKGGFSGRVRVARLGNQSAENLSLLFVVTSDQGTAGRYSVSGMAPPVAVDRLSAGSYRGFDFEVSARNGRADRLFILLISDDAGRIEFALSGDGGGI